MPVDTPWFQRARLKPRQLMLVSAIADEGNIHRAAQVLNVSQPAASKLLKDLEDVLGVPLFDRLPRGMRATWYGETLVRHARIALASLREAGQDIDAIREGRLGEVRIGAIAGPSLSLLPNALAIVAREQPGLRVQLQVESSDVLIESLSQGRLDIMVGRLFERHDKSGLQYEKLGDEPVCAVARQGHPLLQTGALELSQVQDAQWIVPPRGSVLRHRFELMFHGAGLGAPQHIIETSALLFMTRMLQQSDFVAVVPTDVGRYYASFGLVEVLPIELSCAMDAFGIITRKDWLLSPAAQIVLQAVRTAAAGADEEPRIQPPRVRSSPRRQ
jgi:DNA-binding transcriptional LysR family regulator